MSALVRLTVDGRSLQAEPGTPVLRVARDAGIEIPTLCEHEALEPFGACRLCMVEVTHEDWGGWHGLVTSCLYPVAEGLVVSTGSDKVVEARRGVLRLLLARTPNAPVIRELAAAHACEVGPLTSDPDADDCILCGLCTRVCTA